MAATIVSELLNLDNYKYWKRQVELYFTFKGLWVTLDDKNRRPRGGPKLEDWNKSDAKALHTILICCGKEALHFVEDSTTAKQAWETLAQKLEYQDKKKSDDFKTKKKKKSDDQRNDHAASRDGDVQPTKELKLEGVVEKELDREGIEGDQISEAQDDDIVELEIEADTKVKVNERPELDNEVETQTAQGDDENNANDYPDYQPFFKVLADQENVDWKVVMDFIKQYPEAVRVKDPSTGRTALHTAVLVRKVDIVKELVKSMTPEDLEITDAMNDTTLCCYRRTSIFGDSDEAVEISKCLIEKNEKLLSIVHPGNDRIVLVNAFVNDFPKLFKYLYSVTPRLEDNITQAAKLICFSLREQKYDIALDLIKKNPSLVLAENGLGISPMNELACLPSAFLTRERLKFWEKWIYDGIKIPPTTNVDDDICIDVPKQDNYQDQDNQSYLIRSSKYIELKCQLFFQKYVEGTNHLYQKKLKHHQILEILECMGKVTKRKDLDPNQSRFIQTSLFQATERGMVEFIVPLFRVNPNIINFRDDNRRTMFHLAVEYRREKIVSLSHGFGDERKKSLFSHKDNNQNKLLHMMGFVSPFTYVNRIRGAALQMQRELQWFKELESMTTLYNREVVNYTNDMKPRELFTKNHIELVKEGEKSMKDTATSCTVGGALIVTMVFAAAFTVPGGNNGETGIPVLFKNKLFKTFIVADAISLCTSTTSVVMFLGILTSRYAEDDFLVSLPRKMILGLLNLFLSVVAMMVAFSSAIFLMLPSQSWIGILAIVLSGMPIATFVWMQFPFLIEILVSTYRPSLFDKKVERFE